jgi:hypothetical protein
VRVTFISGDVHVGAFGCFQAHPKQHMRVVDPKYMLQVDWGGGRGKKRGIMWRVAGGRKAYTNMGWHVTSFCLLVLACHSTYQVHPQVQ